MASDQSDSGGMLPEETPVDRIAEALERIALALERLAPFGVFTGTETIPVPQPQPVPMPVWPQPQRVDCGCPAHHACNNAACPRAPRVTCCSVERGCTRLVIHMLDFTEQELEDFAEAVCDLVKDRGMSDPEQVKVILAAYGWDAPERLEDLVHDIQDGAARIWLPNCAEGGCDE